MANRGSDRIEDVEAHYGDLLGGVRAGMRSFASIAGMSVLCGPFSILLVAGPGLFPSVSYEVQSPLFVVFSWVFLSILATAGLGFVIGRGGWFLLSIREGRLMRDRHRARREFHGE